MAVCAVEGEGREREGRGNDRVWVWGGEDEKGMVGERKDGGGKRGMSRKEKEEVKEGRKERERKGEGNDF